MTALYRRDARAYDLFSREVALVMIAHRDDADVQRAGQRFELSAAARLYRCQGRK